VLLVVLVLRLRLRLRLRQGGRNRTTFSDSSSEPLYVVKHVPLN